MYERKAGMAIVLLVDDDADLIDACGMVIAQRGHKIKAAHSAEEARLILKSCKPDVIVLDVMMETKTAGFDLSREIHQQFPNLPIIMLTSIHQAVQPPYRFEPDETWLPVVKFIDKPADPVALADEIDAALAK